VVDDLDVIAVGVEDEGGVIAGVVGALAGCSVVTSPRRQGGRVKAIDGGSGRGLERQVDASGQLTLAGARFPRRDEELVAPEEVGPSHERNIQDTEHGLVEATARRQIPNHQVHVIEQSTSIELLICHVPNLTFGANGARLIRQGLRRQLRDGATGRHGLGEAEGSLAAAPPTSAPPEPPRDCGPADPAEHEVPNARFARKRQIRPAGGHLFSWVSAGLF